MKSHAVFWSVSFMINVYRSFTWSYMTQLLLVSQSLNTLHSCLTVLPGVLPNNPSLTVKDLVDIRQLEGLFRSHVMIAQMLGQNAEEFTDTCLMAYGFVMRMYKVNFQLWHFHIVNRMMDFEVCKVSETWLWNILLNRVSNTDLSLYIFKNTQR